MIILITARKPEDAHNYFSVHMEGVNNRVWPEVWLHGRPQHAEDQIQWMEGVMEAQRTDHRPFCMVTMSEVYFLCASRAVRTGKLTPDDFEIIYAVPRGQPRRLRLDDDGEFLDRWPDGFFDWRGRLLFTEEDDAIRSVEQAIKKV